MPGFILIVFGTVGLILGLSVYFLRYLTEGRHLIAVRTGIAAFDIGSIGGLFFLFSTHRTDGWAGELILPIILLFVGQLIALAAVMTAAGLRFLMRKTRQIPYDPVRRRILKNAALYPAAGLLLSSYGAFVERHHTVRRDYEIPVRGLPDEADGMLIAQISDVHLGAYFSVEEFEALLSVVAG